MFSCEFAQYFSEQFSQTAPLAATPDKVLRKGKEIGILIFFARMISWIKQKFIVSFISYISKISQKTNISYPLICDTYECVSGDKKC